MVTAAVGIWLVIRSRKESSPAAATDPMAEIVQIILATPSWKAHVEKLAANGGKSFEYKLWEEAKHHYKKRTMEDIRANPENFLGW